MRRFRILSGVLFIIMTVVFMGCQAMRVQTETYVDNCPMPDGFLLHKAVKTAEATLTTCPTKLDEVFQKLIQIAKHKPELENSLLIQQMLKRLVEKGTISSQYSRELYGRYFSPGYVCVPDSKVYNLPNEVAEIKSRLREELALKRKGFIECCNDKAGYEKAESQFNRISLLMDDLVYNEEFNKRELK